MNISRCIDGSALINSLLDAFTIVFDIAFQPARDAEGFFCSKSAMNGLAKRELYLSSYSAYPNVPSVTFCKCSSATAKVKIQQAMRRKEGVSASREMSQ